MKLIREESLVGGNTCSFDPNVLDIEEYNDFGSQLPYEAGSTIKSIAWAAAMDTGNYDGEALVNSNDFYFTADRNNNPVRVNYNTGNRITNSRWKQYGWIPYDYGLILSANTIAALLITEVMTPETYEEYMDAFGLFKKTNAYGFDEATGVKVIIGQLIKSLIRMGKEARTLPCNFCKLTVRFLVTVQ